MEFSMSGYGNFIRDGVPGDLKISINEMPHSKFKRDGSNLYCDEWIKISEAVLGKVLHIQTLHGNSSINVESGCESGKIFTLVGKGVPSMNMSGQVGPNGNLYVKINVTIPKKISSKEKELYQQLLNF